MKKVEKKATKKVEKKPAKKVEKKPAKVAKKTAKVEKKPVKKVEAKKAPAKKAPAKKEEPKKVYHVSKRASDNKWVIKFAGGEKVLKTFNTKQEALTYLEFITKSNKSAVVLTHASKGKKQGKINARIK